jgi:hypothetical protein
VAVPILILLVSFGGGAAVAARWLPDLRRSRIEAVAFVATCGLAGIALAVVGVHVYEIVRQLNSASAGGVGNAKADIVATGVTDTLGDAGPILGIAAVVYLLGSGLATRRPAPSYAVEDE